MKIIFISREGYRLPGARVRCYNFAREISKHGIATEVLSYTDSLGALDGEREADLSLIEKVSFNYKAFLRLSKEKDSIFYIQRFNYHSFAPFLAHLFKKNRIILDLDDWEMREDPKYYFGVYPSSKAHYFTQLIARRSIVCISASIFLRDFLRQFNKATYYIPSGVDTELFKSSSNVLNSEKTIISWIGTLHKKEYIENIKFALDCFSPLRIRHKNIYFDIVADGIYRDSLVKIINKFDDCNISLKNWIAPDEMPSYLDSIHIGVLPVVNRNKFNLSKSPTKLFEYMAMGKPTVCSVIGEAANIVCDGENGYLAQDKGEFTRKMQSLIENPSLRLQFGEKAKKTVENNYSLRILGEQLSEILKTL